MYHLGDMQWTSNGLYQSVFKEDAQCLLADTLRNKQAPPFHFPLAGLELILYFRVKALFMS